MKSTPIYDADAPVACTASADEIEVRADQIERLRAELDRAERTEHGVVLRFPNRPELDADIRAFTVAEKGCCAFWGFAITSASDAITLRWDGPPEVTDFFDRLVQFLEGDEPVAAIAGLL